MRGDELMLNSKRLKVSEKIDVQNQIQKGYNWYFSSKCRGTDRVNFSLSSVCLV